MGILGILGLLFAASQAINVRVLLYLNVTLNTGETKQANLSRIQERDQTRDFPS
jgi:hypothetical protein